MSVKIKELRQARDMTLLQVANRIGVSESTVQRYESGAIANLKYDTIVKLSALFNVSPGELMGWDDSPSSSAPDQELNENERQLVDMYRGMNREGQLKVLDYTADLYESPRYKKEPFISESMEKIG